MTTFVHIADERNAAAIQRTGLTLPHLRRRKSMETPRWKHGVFAMPVIADFMLSHQWLRELKRRGYRTAVGVYFSIPDHEPVWVGRFSDDKRLVTAAHAARLLRETRQLGFETIIPRAIPKAELRVVRNLPQDVGWRYSPEAKGRTPCGCSYCARGAVNGARLREKWARQMGESTIPARRRKKVEQDDHDDHDDDHG